MGDQAGKMCPEVLAEVLKGLLIFRDALVSILLKNAIAMSQEEYSMQYDKVKCSTCLYARLDHAAIFWKFTWKHCSRNLHLTVPHMSAPK